MNRKETMRFYEGRLGNNRAETGRSIVVGSRKGRTIYCIRSLYMINVGAN